MSLSAFTNRPGDHYRYDSITSTFHGKYYCGPLNQQNYNELRPVEEAAKWDPTPGYAGCTDWFRRIKKFTKNEPAISRRLVYGGICEDGSNVVVDYSFEDHINRQYGLEGIVTDDQCGLLNGNAHDESITKALNDATRHYAGIGADLAQARKTCSDFSGLVLKAGGFIKAMRDGNFAGAGGYLKDSLRGKFGFVSGTKNLSHAWLQFIYGWKPLASDLYEAQMIAHDALRKPVPIMAHGKGKAERSYSFNVDRGSADVEYEADWRTYLEANVVNPNLYYLSSAGLINPISIAWETVPFSFVLDWFIPVGNTLQAITAGVGLEYNEGWSSMKTKWSMDVRRRVDYSAPGESFSAFVSPGHLRCECFEFRRQCHAGFPPPKLYADVTPYSSLRAVNAAALVRSLMKN